MKQSEYIDALNRIRDGKPIRVPIGTPINNDSVAIEAGRKKGAIKRSRASFDSLRKEIAAHNTVAQVEPDRIAELEGKVNDLQRLYEEALGREISLMWQLHELVREKGSNVLQFPAGGDNR